jgi:hypothetical protein
MYDSRPFPFQTSLGSVTVRATPRIACFDTRFQATTPMIGSSCGFSGERLGIRNLATHLSEWLSVHDRHMCAWERGFRMIFDHSEMGFT